MAQKIIKAELFKFRTDLENEVRNKVGLTADLKPDYLIEGTRADLAKLQLSDKSIFWGINCQITDTPTQPKTHDKVINRGRKTKNYLE